ncbi:MAG: efflux RND transporter periplasmic adaptor subunit [Mesorhizobium sp.]
MRYASKHGRAGLFFVLTATLAVFLQGCTEGGNTSAPPGGAQGSTEVGVVELHKQTSPKLMELPGRVVALATAEIRPQVNGIIQEIAFKEGRSVQAGDVLYRLDNKSYLAARDASAAAVKKAEATVAGAQSTFNRTQTLVENKTSSPQTLDDARSTLLQAVADQDAAQADLQAAEINLGYTEIKAPISGVIGKSSVSVGSLVTANQTDALATVRQIEPIYVDLVDSSANLLRIREQIEEGRLGIAKADGKPTPPKVNITLETGRPYSETGTITTTDTAVSESTGTFSIRATLDNPRHILLPGMYVRASVDLGTLNDVYLVPQRAVSRNATGKAQAYFVSQDGKADLRTLETDGSTANAWIVTSGVNEGDKLIVDGLSRISAGAAVKPVEVKIDDSGVVQPASALPPASEGGNGGATAQ